MFYQKLKRLINLGKFLDETPFIGKITFWTMIFLGLSFFITGRKVFLQNSYAGLIIFIQIVFFGLLLKHFSGNAFNKIWNAKNGFVRKKWEDLNEISLVLTKILLFGLVSYLTIFHLVQYFLLRNSNSLLSYEQGAIGLFFLILTVWFFFGGRKDPSYPHSVALASFFFMLFIIVYNFLLFGVIQIVGGPPWTGRLETPLILSFIGTLTMIFPEFFVIPILNIKQMIKTIKGGIKSLRNYFLNNFF